MRVTWVNSRKELRNGTYHVNKHRIRVNYFFSDQGLFSFVSIVSRRRGSGKIYVGSGRTDNGIFKGKGNAYGKAEKDLSEHYRYARQ